MARWLVATGAYSYVEPPVATADRVTDPDPRHVDAMLGLKDMPEAVPGQTPFLVAKVVEAGRMVSSSQFMVIAGGHFSEPFIVMNA